MKQVYKTSDGAIFENEETGQAHEDQLTLLAPADEFGKALLKAGFSQSATARRVNAAIQYIQFVETGRLPEAPAQS